jgi:archaellum component FlaG (FlaF/FlaG flagellin family)
MRRYTSVALSPLVAVILLIAITVAAAVVVSGVFFNLASIAGRRPTAIIDQVKLVASPVTPNDAGTFTVVLKNTGDVPISTTNPTINISGLPGTCTFTTFTWTGGRNPGQTLSATSTDTAGCAGAIGTTATVTITVTFVDGSTQVLTTAVTGAIA